MPDCNAGRGKRDPPPRNTIIGISNPTGILIFASTDTRSVGGRKSKLNAYIKKSKITDFYLLKNSKIKSIFCIQPIIPIFHYSNVCSSYGMAMK